MESTKQYIASKAFGLFLTCSYKEVTLKRLLKETALSKGAFYHHFSSKEDLFEQVVDQFFFAAADTVRFSPSKELSFHENMTALLESKQKAFAWFAGKYGDLQQEMNFFLFLVEAIRHLASVRDKVEKMVALETETIRLILEMAEKNRELKPGPDLDLLAEHLVKALDGYEMHGVLLGLSSETFALQKQMIGQLWALIKT